MAASHGNPLVQLGLAAGWGRHRADVSDYAGKTIRLRFHLDSDHNVQRRGVAIDDVRVYQRSSSGRRLTPRPRRGGAADGARRRIAGEPAISDLRLESRCVRRSSSGRVRVPMTDAAAQPGTVRARVTARSAAATGEAARGQPGAQSAVPPRLDLPARRQVRAAAVPRQVMLDLRLRPGLYRLTVRVQLKDGTLSPPARRFLRVVG